MDLTVEPARVEDYESFVRLFAELAVPEPPPPLERFTSTIAPDTVMVRVDGTVAGYAWSRTRGDALHVVHVVTAPDFRKRGVGVRLMDAVAARARELGHARWMLNVKPENVAARALYERAGLNVAFESASVRVRWSDVGRIAPGESLDPRARIVRLGTDDDVRYERGLPLLPGELAAIRSLDRIIVGAETDDGPLGVLALDPPFPGASPVRVRSPAVARALLEAVRAHAVASHEHLFVFAEGHPELLAALVEAGGEIAMRVLRMEGPVPPETG